MEGAGGFAADEAFVEEAAAAVVEVEVEVEEELDGGEMLELSSLVLKVRFE